jgi:hypothetical protein
VLLQLRKYKTGWHKQQALLYDDIIIDKDKEARADKFSKVSLSLCSDIKDYRSRTHWIQK